MKKFISLISYVLFICAGLTPVVQAQDDGQCSSSQVFNNDFGGMSFNDPEQNLPGYILPKTSNWNNSGGKYSATCKCISIQSGYTWYWSTTNMSLYSKKDGWNYYVVNEYIAVATKIFIAKNDYLAVPFTKVSNNVHQNCKEQDAFNSGGKGQVKIMITKPVVGNININQKEIAKLYAMVGYNPYSPNFGDPLSKVYMSISIESPQSCNFQVGDTITMDFGDIAVNSFASIGGQPNGVNKQTVNLTYDCDNIMQSNQLRAKLQSTPDPDFADASKSNLKGIGIIAEKDGEIIKPNTNFATQFDNETNQGNIEFQLYPTRTKSQQDTQTGKLNTNLEIRLDIQ